MDCAAANTAGVKEGKKLAVGSDQMLDCKAPLHKGRHELIIIASLVIFSEWAKNEARLRNLFGQRAPRHEDIHKLPVAML